MLYRMVSNDDLILVVVFKVFMVYIYIYIYSYGYMYIKNNFKSCVFFFI